MGRARQGGTPRVGLGNQDCMVTAVSSTARDVEMGEAESFSHMEALAPGGGCTASYGVAWVSQS